MSDFPYTDEQVEQVARALSGTEDAVRVLRGLHGAGITVTFPEPRYYVMSGMGDGDNRWWDVWERNPDGGGNVAAAGFRGANAERYAPRARRPAQPGGVGVSDLQRLREVAERGHAAYGRMVDIGRGISAVTDEDREAISDYDVTFGLCDDDEGPTRVLALLDVAEAAEVWCGGEHALLPRRVADALDRLREVAR